jgi:hypothetical protein
LLSLSRLLHLLHIYSLVKKWMWIASYCITIRLL